MFREGTCPNCQEKLQVPDDRDTVICMFCGAQIRVSEAIKEKPQMDLAAYGEYYNKAMEGMAEIIHSCDEPSRGFKKDQYEDNFLQFSAKYRSAYEAADRVYQWEEQPEKWLKKLSVHMIDAAREEIRACKGKTRQGQLQMDLNFLVSIYLIPSVRGCSLAFSEPFVDCLLQSWEEAFQIRLGKAKYDDIEAGFHKKLCYITTAVCEGLGKDAQCEELRLLKQYRDQVLSKTEDGRQLIWEYYDIAPTIVKRMERQPDRDQQYQELYQTYLSPCIRQIQERRYEECLSLYSQMVLELKEKYMGNTLTS